MEPRNPNICIYIIFIYIGSFYCQESSTEEPVTTSTAPPIIVMYDGEKETYFLYWLWGLIAANLVVACILTVLSTCLIQKCIGLRKRSKREKRKNSWRHQRTIYQPNNLNKREINEIPMKVEPEVKDKTVETEKAKLMKTEDEGENQKTEQKLVQPPPSEKAKKKSAEKEYQYQNKGPIKFWTQNAVANNFFEDVKETPKKSIKQVKWAPEPYVFYEIGPGVDQIEMIDKVPSSSSDIMTASIRNIETKTK
ncbi:unnamed protein product [Caenorhabditis brenneri]